jgi:hypothetical protein
VDLAEAQVQRVTNFLGRLLAAWSSFHYTERIVAAVRSRCRESWMAHPLLSSVVDSTTRK